MHRAFLVLLSLLKLSTFDLQQIFNNLCSLDLTKNVKKINVLNKGKLHQILENTIQKITVDTKKISKIAENRTSKDCNKL